MSDTHKVVLDHGKLAKSPIDKKSDYSFLSPSSFFSPTTNLIPQLSGISGGRVLLGDKASLQAISLVHREAPLVKSRNEETDESFVKEYAKPMAAVFSKVKGKVNSIKDNIIMVGDTPHHIYDNFLTGHKSFIHHEPIVKVGDEVKEGDLLAKSNFTDSHGNLALGVNLTTAVMPYRSSNYEDAYVITEAGAKKLAGEQMIPLTVEKERGLDFNKNKYISLFPNKYVNSQLENVDSDGVIKKGTTVKNGDPLLLSFEPRTLRTTDAQLGNISGILKNAFSDRSQKWEYDSPGEVMDVAKTNKLVTITIKTRRPISVADKLSVSAGAKGVVGAILSDSQSPVTKDGKPVDIILNSMSVVSRVAPGLLTSIALGKVAQKTGRALSINGFDEKSNIDNAQKILKENGLHEMEDIYDPLSNKHLNVMVGPMYVTRLHHISEDKASSRGQGGSYDINMQPAKVSGGDKSKRLGNLGTNILISRNMRHVLEDAGTIRGTKNDEYWRKLKLGEDLPNPEVPFIFNKFISHLEGAGIKVQRDGTRFNVLPQTNKDVENLSKAEIENANIYKLKAGELIPEEGGLFDVNKVGIGGDNYTHINLKYPVINPITEDYIRKTLNITKDKFNDLVGKGQLIDLLKSINLDSKIKELEKDIKSARKSDRDNKLKVLAFLKNLKNNNIDLKDLIINKIPVIPAKFRPLVVQGGRVISSGVNELYRDLMLVNQSTDGLPEDIAEGVRRKQYDGVKAVYGLGSPISTRNEKKNFKGLLASALGLQGGSAKGSMFQSKVVNKPLDLTGRAVLTTDSNLDIDEVSLPHEAVWKSYSPFVIRRLVQSGLPAVHAKEYVENKHPIAREHLLDELKDRPINVIRDPQIALHSSQGFFVKMNSDPKDTSIKLNPLLSKGFAYDLDGDALTYFVPSSEKAKDEIKNKMLPSKNLLFPRNFGPAYIPSNESALGLYQASTLNNKNNPRKFNNVDEVRKAYEKGELHLGDNVLLS